MSNAKIIAKLVEAGHEDLADELIKVATAARVTPMGAAKFWAIVKSIGWGTKTTDNQKIKKKLLHDLDAQEGPSFYEAYDQAKNKLDQKIDKFVELGGDSYGDLLSHIVGLGKKEYDAVMKNPKLAGERAARRDFKESFDYAVPFPAEFEHKDIGTFIRKAEHILKTGWIKQPDVDDTAGYIERLKKSDPAEHKKMMKSVDVVNNGLKVLVKTKDAQKFLATRNAVSKAGNYLLDYFGQDRIVVFDILMMYSNLNESLEYK